MKKTLVILAVVLMVLATGCKKNKKSKALNYNDSNPIVMALSGPSSVYGTEFDYKIDVSSDYDITYTAINEHGTVISVSQDGKIHGINVGTAKVKMDNGYESKTVDVNVDLFIEPTFEFGCDTTRIKRLHGNPKNTGTVDTILVYQYIGPHGYSYACGEMDFFFHNNQYFEADVYIRPSVEYMLGQYLEDNFNFVTILGDTLSVYRNKLDPTVVCGKFASHNEWDEWCLYYIQEDQERSFASFLKNRPRSSKLRY